MDTWRALAGDQVDALSTTTPDGLTIAPIHLDGPGIPDLGPHPERHCWDNRQHCTGADPAELRAAVDGGATSIWLDVPDPAVLPDLLAELPVDRIGLVLNADDVPKAAEVVLEHAPAVHGNLGAGGDLAPGIIAGLAARCATTRPGLRALTVDATAQPTDVAELAHALTVAVTHLRTLTTAGMDVPSAFGQIEFRYAAGADQFAVIAKLRAARLMWARVAAACGLPPVRQLQHVVTTGTAIVDMPHKNILRNTVAAFAAAVGGADAITVRPHTTGATAQRLARTIGPLLRHEAHLARVHDPAGGSWFVETFTRDLARAAWARFQEMSR